MTKIRDIKSKIEDRGITIDEVIIIQVLNLRDSSFPQFLDILSYKAKKKAKLHILKSLTKFLKDEEPQMKN